MIAVRVWCLIALCVTILQAQPLSEVQDKRNLGVLGVVTFPKSTVVTGQLYDSIMSEADAGIELKRDQRSPDEYEDYVDEEDDGPEGRHLHKIKRKFKRKFKPHKYQHGGFPGGLGDYGGHGGHQHHHHHHQHGGYGAYDCRKPHGCGGFGGWQQPSYGGGPIATAIAGSNHGGWNPGFGGYGSRPGGNAQAAAWHLGPFSIGFANAGK